MSQTIMQAWREAYNQFKSDCLSDGEHPYNELNGSTQSEIIYEYRPDSVVEMFGCDWADKTLPFDNVQFFDTIDNAMFSCFMRWAIQDLQSEFQADMPKEVDDFRIDSNGEYMKDITRIAFEAWKIGKGL